MTSFDAAALDTVEQKYRESLKQQLSYDFYRQFRSILVENGTNVDLFLKLSPGGQVKRLDLIVENLLLAENPGSDSITVSRIDGMVGPSALNGHVGKKYGYPDLLHGFSMAEFLSPYESFEDLCENYNREVNQFDSKSARIQQSFPLFRGVRQRFLAQKKLRFDHELVVELKTSPSLLGSAVLAKYHSLFD